MEISTDYFRLIMFLNRFLLSEEKKALWLWAFSGIQIISYTQSSYQLGIYVKKTMRRRNEALTTWILKSFGLNVQKPKEVHV